MRGFFLALIGAGLVAIGGVSAVVMAKSVEPAQALEKGRIEETVKNYLSHKEQTANANPILDSRQELYQDKDDPSSGPVQARVTLVEFFDYRCPYCKQMAKGIEQLLAHDPDLRVVFKEFPILAPDSVTAAKAALAANLQGKYLPFHRLLMEHRGVFDQETIDTLGAQAELDLDRLHRDMEDPALLEQLKANHRLAEKLGVDGTPAFIMGGQLIPGAVPIDELAEAIRKLAINGGG